MVDVQGPAVIRPVWVWPWLLLTLVGSPAQAEPHLSPLAGSQAVPAAPWRLTGLPQQRMSATQYSIVTLGGQQVLRVQADDSYGNLIHPLPGLKGAKQLSWRWRLDQSNPQADLRQKAGDDSAVKVCLLFDLPLDAVPFFERQLLRIARSQSAEPLPAASLCYVWDSKLAPGTLLDNAYSRRVRYIVLQGPTSPLASWRSEKRDIEADWRRAFGDEALSAPPLQAVAVAGDADNTHGRSLAHVADVSLD